MPSPCHQLLCLLHLPPLTSSPSTPYSLTLPLSIRCLPFSIRYPRLSPLKTYDFHHQPEVSTSFTFIDFHLSKSIPSLSLPFSTFEQG